MPGIEIARRLQIMLSKACVQLSCELEGCNAKVLTAGAAFWKSLLANAVLKPVGRGEPLSRMGEGQG